MSIHSNLIVNADDFGLKSSVNRAIVEAFDKNYINSTTIMANMPGFEEAVQLAHKHNITHQIGAHLVLTEGLSLTDEIKSLKYLFNKKINSSNQFIKKLFFLNKKEKDLIFREYCTQIEKIKSNGIPISHIDTHHQIHDMWAINQILLELLKTYKIPFMRILNNLESTKIHKNIYRNLNNKRLKRLKVNNTDYFGTQLDFLLKIKKYPNLIKNKKVEIVVHPDYNSKGKLIDILHNKEYNFDFLEPVQQTLTSLI